MADDDGFSDPDPAPIDADEADADLGLIPEGGSMLDFIDESVNCRNCVHYRTCGIVAGIRPLLEDYRAGDPEDEPPIEITRLAVICEEFEPDAGEQAVIPPE